MLVDKIHIIPRRRLTDERGWFVKLMDRNEDFSSHPCEIYVTSATPGQSKGGDYSKSTNKWFTIVQGKAILKIEDVETREKLTIELDQNRPQTVYVPHMVANIFINNGDEDFILVAYADRKYDKNDIIPYTL